MRAAKVITSTAIHSGNSISLHGSTDGEGGFRLELPFATSTVPQFDLAPGRCWAMNRSEDLSMATAGPVDFHSVSASEVTVTSGHPLPIRVKSNRIYTWSKMENEDER